MLAALIKKELLALTRDVHGLTALFVMPAVFIVVMSLALKDVYTPPGTLRYAVDNQDQGELALLLGRVWRAHHGDPQPLPADWQAQLRAGRLKYVLVLQPGLSDELALPAMPDGARIQLLAEPGIDGNLFNSIRAELIGTAGELKARTLLASGDTTASMEALVHAERFASQGPSPSAVQQNVPAWLVFGMFFVIASMSTIFVQERSTGVLARLQSLSVPRFVWLASKTLPYLGVNAIQAALMLGVGVFLMPLIGGEALAMKGIHWGALLIALAAISLAAVGMALALACAVRTHAQASAIGPVVNVLMAAIGGIMVPVVVMPRLMQRLATLSPMNWGLEALLNVLLRGGDVASTLPDVLRLGAFAAVMFLTSLFLFPRSTR